jgi:two-component system response regulator PrrA
MATILVIEDDPHVAQLYTDKLKIAGYDVAVAVDGAQGLRQALEERPAVVLLDMNLPTMDGSAVLQQLRADERGKEVPVIILTNDVEEDRLTAVAGLYSDHFLKVDLALDELVEKVKSYA